MNKLITLCFCIISILAFGQKPELVVPTGHNAGITKMALSANGKYFATSSLDKTAKVYSFPSLNELYTFSAGWEPREVAVSPDGRFAAASNGFNIIIASLATGKVVKEIENRSSPGFIFDPVQPYLYYAEFNTGTKMLTVKKLNLSSFTATNVISFPSLSGEDIFNISEDGSKLYMPSTDNLIDLKTSQAKKVEGRYLLPNGNILDLGLENKLLKFKVVNQNNEKIWEKVIPGIEPVNTYGKSHYHATKTTFYYVEIKLRKLIACDIKTGAVTVKDLPKEIINSNVFAVAGVGLFMSDQGTIYTVNPESMAIVEKHEVSSPYPAKVITGSGGTNKIAIGTKYPSKDKIKIATLGKQGVTVVDGDIAKEVTTLGLSDDGTFLGVGYDYNFGLYNATNFKKFVYTGSPVDILNTIGFAANNSTVFLQAPDGFVIYKDGNYTTPTKKIATTYTGSHRFNEIADITQKGDKITSYFIERPSTEAPSKYSLRCYNASTGEKLWEKPGEYTIVRYSSDDKKITTVRMKPLTILELDANTGAELSSKVVPITNDERVSVSKDGNYVAVYTNKTLNIHNVRNKQAATLQSPLSWQDVMAYFGDDFLIAIEGDGFIRLYDGRNAKFLATVIIYNNNEWAVVTEDGYFDGSQNAIATMYYRIGDKTVGLEQFYEGFYTPGLLGQILDRSFKPTSPVVINDIKSPPIVTLKYEQGTRNLTVEDDETVEVIKTTATAAKIIVNATAPNDKVAELRLYHNGKLITNKSRNLTVEDDEANNTFNKVYEIELLPGTNTFKAVALNSQRTESSPAMLTVNLEGEKAKPQPQGIQLHMIVVGINEYKNPKYNLNYAVADASSFQDAIKNGMSTITSKVNVTFIKNSEANRNNIYSKLQEVANKANPQDVFIFYYAGHGMMSEDANPDFYLVPYDVTQIYGDDGGIKKKGISATELKLLASKISAQKQLYVLDACQSAGALTSVAARGAPEEKAIAQLARSTGTHWLTASGSQQFATEFDQLGHGIFTYVFLDALKGKADSGDGRITVNEIKAYLESQVPELSQKYNGSPQYPSSFGFGQDFPVGVKN